MIFKQMLIEPFGGDSIENSCMITICAPLISANHFILDRLTADEPRYII